MHLLIFMNQEITRCIKTLDGKRKVKIGEPIFLGEETGLDEERAQDLNSVAACSGFGLECCHDSGIAVQCDEEGSHPADFS